MTDRFSMAHSLEARVPFLDHVLVEKVFSIPSSVRTKDGDLKYLFKRAISDLLPEELLTARKRGFVIPIKLWLRRELRPLVDRLLHPDRLGQQGLFRRQFYSLFVLPHLEGRADFTWQVWAALMFQLWYVVFIERQQSEAPGYDSKAIAAME
jgi:asparagine synthase (glutamine-hydrolysing)